MALDPLALFNEARNVYGFTGTLQQVMDAISAVDRTPFEEAERARYRIEIWDEQTPINGLSPEFLRQHWGNTWPAGGKVYMIYIDGNLRIVQYFDPDASFGYVPMDEQTALIRAQAFVDSRVEEAVDAKVKAQVLMTLLS